MVELVLAVSTVFVVLLLVEPLKQRLDRRRYRRWHNYFKN